MPRPIEKALTWLGLGALFVFNTLLTAAPFFFVFEGRVREVSKTPFLRGVTPFRMTLLGFGVP